MAKRVVEIGRDDSDEEVAGAAYDRLQKKLRVTSNQADDSKEISLKAPKCSGDSDEEFMGLLFGDSTGISNAKPSTKNGSDDEDQNANKKKKRKTNANTASGAQSSTDKAGHETASLSSGAWDFPVMTSGTSGKGKKTNEGKEMDKSEAVVLQANQLKCQVEDAKTFMMVSTSKVKSMLDKVQARLTEDQTKVLLDVIKNEGPHCRAAKVWQGLKDTLALLESLSDFVEALHDREAAQATLANRATALKGLGVNLPRSISSILCRRSIEELVKQFEFQLVFKNLDIKCKDECPNGVSTILPADGDETEKASMLYEFQVACMAQVINNLLLKDHTSPETG